MGRYLILQNFGLDGANLLAGSVVDLTETDFGDNFQSFVNAGFLEASDAPTYTPGGNTPVTQPVPSFLLANYLLFGVIAPVPVAGFFLNASGQTGSSFSGSVPASSSGSPTTLATLLGSSLPTDAVAAVISSIAFDLWLSGGGSAGLADFEANFTSYFRQAAIDTGVKLGGSAIALLNTGANFLAGCDLASYRFLGANSDSPVTGYYVNSGGQIGPTFSATVPESTGSQNPYAITDISGGAIPTGAVGAVLTSITADLVVAPCGSSTSDFMANPGRYWRAKATTSGLSLGRASL